MKILFYKALYDFCCKRFAKTKRHRWLPLCTYFLRKKIQAVWQRDNKQHYDVETLAINAQLKASIRKAMKP